MNYDPTKGFTFYVQHIEDGGDYECVDKDNPDAHYTTFHLKVHEGCEFASNCSVSTNLEHFNSTDRPNSIASSTDYYGVDAEAPEAFEATETAEANIPSIGAGFSFAGVFNKQKMVMDD